VFLKKYYEEEKGKFLGDKVEPPAIIINHGATS
jgi:hypothetical protein